jgi:hypothetical protein
MFENLQIFNQTSSIVSLLNRNCIMIKKDKQLFSSSSSKNFRKISIRGGNKNQVNSKFKKELNNNIINEEKQNKQNSLAIIPYNQSNTINSDKIVKTKFDVLNQQKYKILMPSYKLPKESYPLDYYDMTNYPLPLRNGYFFYTEFNRFNLVLRPN